jgi:hypothetical protein
MLLRGRRPARVGLAAALALMGSAAATVPGAATMTADAAVSGGIDFPDPNSGNGLWFIGCQAAQWTLSMSAVGAAVDTLNDETAGDTSISASASTPCSFISGGDVGTITLSAATNLGIGDLECPSMSGTYTEVDLHWSVSVSGDCTLNGKPEPGERLALSFAGVPTTIGGDLGNFTHLVVAGTASWS